MTTETIDITKLSPAQLAALYSQMRDVERAERDARKARREQNRAFLAKFVGVLVRKFEPQTFKSGAVGWSMGGRDIDVTLPDGTTRKARVSLLVRWENTIPAGDNSGTDEE